MGRHRSAQRWSSADLLDRSGLYRPGEAGQGEARLPGLEGKFGRRGRRRGGGYLRRRLRSALEGGGEIAEGIAAPGAELVSVIPVTRSMNRSTEVCSSGSEHTKPPTVHGDTTMAGTRNPEPI